MKETQIQKDIIDYLTVNGWLVWKNKNVNRNTGIYLPTLQKGVPDLTALKKGWVWFLEIKTKKGVLSNEQLEFGNQIIKRYGNWAVLRSIEDAKKINKIANRRRKNEKENL